ncbi:hypothetical protein F5890DRAFT_1373821, partial [Lentinula detonsa]
LFEKYGLQDLKPKATPLAPGIVLTLEQGPKTAEEHEYMKDKPYSGLLSSIQF